MFSRLVKALASSGALADLAMPLMPVLSGIRINA